MSGTAPGVSFEHLRARIEELETLARRAVGSSATSAAANIVWRPGAVSAGNVYATWAEVVAAVATLSGATTITVDDSLATATIPAGSWDLRPSGKEGPVVLVNGNRVTPFGAFVTIAHAAVTIHGLSGLDGVQLENHSTVDVITATAVDNVTFFMRLGTLYQSIDAGAAAFLKVTGGTSVLVLDDQSIVGTLDGGSNAIRVTAGAPGLYIQVNDSSSFQADMLTAGVLQAQVNCTGPAADPSFPAYATQTGAPLILPFGLIQKGSAAIVVGTGKSAAIPAFVGPNTTIECTQRVPVGDAATVRYAAITADRVNGNPGTFQISALSAGGGGAINGADTSTVDYVVYN